MLFKTKINLALFIECLIFEREVLVAIARVEVTSSVIFYYYGGRTGWVRLLRTEVPSHNYPSEAK